MVNVLLGSTAVLAVVVAGLYQVHFKSIFDAVGLLGRDIHDLNNKNCKQIPELTACEKVVIHNPTGSIFAACSTPDSRIQWTPANQHLNASGRSTEDFVGIYDPATSSLRKLTLSGFTDLRGYNAHGMDVVQSSSPGHSSEIFVYLVNQRPPLDWDASKGDKVEFVNSSVEIFRMSALESGTLEHVKTIEHELIQSPNDVVGSPDGKSFWVTNDGSHARGFTLHSQLWLKRPGSSSIVYCHVDTGCKVATENLLAANGLARAPSSTTATGMDKFYVANHLFPQIKVLERQADDTLVVTDDVEIPYPGDNISVDSSGAVWIAGAPLLFNRASKHFENWTIPDPSAAIRVTLNTGRSAFFGEKFRIEKIFEDGGELASGMTTAAYDGERGRLVLSGLVSKTVICDLPKTQFDVDSMAAAAAAA